MNQTLTAGFTLRDTDKQRLQASLSLTTDYDLQQFLQPKDSDYVMIPVRALSATEVQSRMFNFGHLGGGPLRNSISEFNNLIILKDHDMSVDNWIGTTEQAYWDQSADIPPGVNVMMKVDTKADPKTARGLISGALNSVSVTVSFDYEPSHPDMNEMDFVMNLGQEVDGKTVQALITGIKRVYELSTVWSGADVYAKTSNGGPPPKPLSQSLHLALPTENKEKAVDLKKVAALLSLQLAEPTEEDVNVGITALVAKASTTKTELDTLKTELEAKKTEVAELNTKVGTFQVEITTLKTGQAELAKEAEVGKAFLKTQREEAVRLYTLVENKDVSPAMVEMLKNSTLEIAQSFVVSYSKRAEQIAPLKCSVCQNATSDVSRRSSAQNTDKPEGDHRTSADDVRLTKAVSSIHG
jgi:hypothetical protein